MNRTITLFLAMLANPFIIPRSVYLRGGRFQNNGIVSGQEDWIRIQAACDNTVPFIIPHSQ